MEMPPAFHRMCYRGRLAWERVTLAPDEQLRRACARGDLIRAQRAVLKGADINKPRGNAPYAHYLKPSLRTPLHVAALCGEPHIADWLIGQGANPWVFDRPRWDTPAHLAAWQVEQAMEQGDDPTPYQEVLGILWKADPGVFHQGNRFEETAMTLLPREIRGDPAIRAHAREMEDILPPGSRAAGARQRL